MDLFDYLLLGWTLVFIQVPFAYVDGYLTRKQLRLRGIKGWCLLEHGGWWMDVTFITFAVAALLDYCRLPLLTKGGLTILAVIIFVTMCAGFYFSKKAAKIPEAYTHDGQTTWAGRVHGIYAVSAAWILATFYLMSDSADFRHWALWVSVPLTPFFFFGAVKFNPNWKVDKNTVLQTIGGSVTVWGITVFRLLHEQNS